MDIKYLNKDYKLMNDLKKYLSNEGLVGNNDNTKGIIFSAVVFTFVVISLVIVVVYGATHDTATVTEYYRSYINDYNRSSIKFERIVLSISNAY
ncbi:MAG: hypothetical protein ACQPRJ_05320 [Solitalea-like symbiont of Acarus siro]